MGVVTHEARLDEELRDELSPLSGHTLGFEYPGA